jgi:hypothetical protein
MLMDNNSTPNAWDLCTPIDLQECSLGTALEIYQFLSKYSESAAESYRHRARQQFPLAAGFQKDNDSIKKL